MIVFRKILSCFQPNVFNNKAIKLFCTLHVPGEGDYDFDRLINEDQQYNELKRVHIIDGRRSHQIMVAQPYIKFPASGEPPTSTPELRLQEAVSLAHSIPHWRVLDKGLFPVPHYQRPLLFSQTIVESLEARVKCDSTISAVFVGVNRLLGSQQAELEKILSVPVFDRFSIILEIFKHHATTGEAKVQIGLAELAYLRSRIHQKLPASRGNSYSFGRTQGGSGETPLQRYRKVLEARGKLLREALERLDRFKEMARIRRKKFDLPIIGVIGYTNCGKTSLIKALSKDGNLSPEDRLFATLQVTAHPVTLPSFKNALFLDSIGFISDIPKELMDSFNVTFKDVANSDLLVHVYDASHPDLPNQLETVTKTMVQLAFPEKLVSSAINVANKIDLLEGNEEVDPNHIKVSATEGTNLQTLIKEIDVKLVDNTGHSFVCLKVPNGGPELGWLYRESTVESVEPDEDVNFLIVKTFMPPSSKQKFSSYFKEGIILK